MGGSNSVTFDQAITNIELDIVPVELPQQYSLEQNYPNPFNPATVIRYTLSVKGYVTLKVYNVLGQEVATLVDRVQEAGFRSIGFTADDLPTGIYVYRLSVG